MPLIETVGSGAARVYGFTSSNNLGLVSGNPASSGVALYDAGYRTSGLYYITTSQGVKQVYVDLTTLDATTNKAGWMLVGSWAQASRWTIQANTVASVIDGTTPVNGFGNSFGTMPANFVRVHVSTLISNTATNATSGDWYYYNSTATTWREWNVQDSANTVWLPPAESPATNGGATNFIRDNFKQFTSAYNLKFGYSVGQRWNGFADSTPGISTQGDWWNGLNGTVTAIGRNGTGDGSFAILPQGSASTTAGQDCNQNQSKFGLDDSSLGGATNVAWFGTTATSDLNANTGFQGSDTNFWLWIK